MKSSNCEIICPGSSDAKAAINKHLKGKKNMKEAPYPVVTKTVPTFTFVE